MSSKPKARLTQKGNVKLTLTPMQASLIRALIIETSFDHPSAKPLDEVNAALRELSNAGDIPPMRVAERGVPPLTFKAL